MTEKHLAAIHAAGINLDKDSPLQTIMENLAKDLVELELQSPNSPVLQAVTETYQRVYDKLIESQRSN